MTRSDGDGAGVMCYGCWEKQGKPTLRTPAIEQAAHAIQTLYTFHASGGRLHIVTDDWNLEDHHLDFCENLIQTEPDDPEYDTPESREAERCCLAALKLLTLQERASAMALADGLTRSDGDG